MTKAKLKIYLKRTERLLELWKTKVPREKVVLNMLASNLETGEEIYTFKQMNSCMSVACLAGWANIFSRTKHRINDFEEEVNSSGGRMISMNYEYGIYALPWYGKNNEFFFDLKSDFNISDWKEGENRIRSRIKQLKKELSKS